MPSDRASPEPLQPKRQKTADANDGDWQQRNLLSLLSSHSTRAALTKEAGSAQHQPTAGALR